MEQTCATQRARLPAAGKPVSATKGSPFTNTAVATLAGITFGIFSQLTATVSWAAGMTPVTIDNTEATAANGSITFDSSTGTATVLGNYEYLTAGNEAISVTFSVGGQELGMVDSLATVADAAISVTASTDLTATRGAEQSLDVATFTDANDAAEAADFVAKVTWADGSTSLGNVSYDPSQNAFVVFAEHAFSADGSQSFSVTVSDAGGSSDTADGGSVVVSDPLLEQAWGNQYVLSGQSFSGTVATFINPGGPLARQRLLGHGGRL